MTMQFKDTYREWNEKVQPSEELLSRLLTEASKVTEASEISGAEASAKRQKKRNDKVRENKIQGKQNHNRRWGRGIAAAAGLLLVINVSLPVLAGTFPTIYELMYLVVSVTKRCVVSWVMSAAEIGPSKFPPPYGRVFQAVEPSPILYLHVSDS